MISVTVGLLKGPHIVVAVHEGKVVACFFHLTRAASERRIERIARSYSFRNTEARAYSLPELLHYYHIAEAREMEELERIAKL